MFTFTILRIVCEIQLYCQIILFIWDMKMIEMYTFFNNSVIKDCFHVCNLTEVK